MSETKQAGGAAIALVPQGVCSNCGYWAKLGAVVGFLGDYSLCFGCIQFALDQADEVPDAWKETNA